MIVHARIVTSTNNVPRRAPWSLSPQPRIHPVHHQQPGLTPIGSRGSIQPRVNPLPSSKHFRIIYNHLQLSCSQHLRNVQETSRNKMCNIKISQYEPSKNEWAHSKPRRLLRHSTSWAKWGIFAEGTTLQCPRPPSSNEHYAFKATWRKMNLKWIKMKSIFKEFEKWLEHVRMLWMACRWPPRRWFISSTCAA